MPTVRLSRREIQYLLLERRLVPDSVRLQFEAFGQAGADPADVGIEDAARVHTADLVTARLAEVGFDEGESLSAEGRFLEDLIDKLNEPDLR